MFRIYDITLLSREEPDDVSRLDGEQASEVTSLLATAGFDPGDGDGFDENARAALESFRGVNNFENQSISVLEDAIVHGLPDATGTGAERLVDAIWHGLSRLDRV